VPGGVVRDPEVHLAVLRSVADAARKLGIPPVGVIASPILGPEGNREFLMHLRVGTGGGTEDVPADLDDQFRALTAP
jgi:23S rRNA (cytidine1920-2'-O)/16S rRNA (cytidine1409-2'-O)-methyltransferase